MKKHNSKLTHCVIYGTFKVCVFTNINMYILVLLKLSDIMLTSENDVNSICIILFARICCDRLRYRFDGKMIAYFREKTCRKITVSRDFAYFLHIKSCLFGNFPPEKKGLGLLLMVI